MKKLLLLIVLLITVNVFADEDWYVDPDAVGTGTGVDWTNAYTALQTAVAAKASDLVTNTKIVTFHCRSSSGTDDTTPVVVDGYTTSADYYIDFVQEDFPTDGIPDFTKYNLHVTNGVGIMINEDYVRWKGQIQVTSTDANNAYGIEISVVGTTDIRLSGIIKGNCSGTGNVYGVRQNDSSSTILIYNMIIQDFISGADTSHSGIRSDSASVTNVYNSVVTNCWRGLNRGGGAMTVKNTVSFNNNDDWFGTITADYCASDDPNTDVTSGTNFVALNENASGEWTASFTNYSANNFSVKDVSSPIYNTGTDLSGSGVTTDIIGTARPQATTYDIGAFEFLASSPAATGRRPRVIFIN